MTTKLSLETAVDISEIEVGGALRQVARPRSEAELTALLSDLRRARESGADLRAAFLGRGSAARWCMPTQWSAHGAPPTLWISTESLVAEGSTGIIEYVPGDGTLTAQAGAHIETLRAAVLEGGHRISPAGPLSGSTLGGMLASGVSGIDRCTFGPARHHVLGMRIQDASGRGPTRTGARLVKNVTGYDLHRLHSGARGTLGAILEASLRLMPVPEAEVYVTSRPFKSAAEAATAALQLRGNGTLQPRALFILGRTLHLVLGGRARQVQVELDAALVDLDAAPPRHGTDAMDQAVEAARHDTALIIAAAPSQVAAVLETVEQIGLDGAAGLYVEPDAALIEIGTDELRASVAGLVESVLPALDPDLVHVSLRGPAHGFPELEAALHARRTAPPAVSLWTARLQASFDPSGVLRSPDFPPLKGLL